jgi:Spy/CpxP family protein refolding chaperone
LGIAYWGFDAVLIPNFKSIIFNMKNITTSITTALFALLLTFFSQTLCAQAGPPFGPPPHHGGPPPGKAGEDAIRKNFYPPEIVMRHQSDIALTDEQRKFIIAEMQEAQKNFTEWQWSLEAETEKMQKLLANAKVDEAQVLLQLDKVLALEKQIKTQQLKLMIAVKNKLTAEQQKKLDELKKEKEKERK